MVLKVFPFRLKKEYFLPASRVRWWTPASNSIWVIRLPWGLTCQAIFVCGAAHENWCCRRSLGEMGPVRPPVPWRRGIVLSQEKRKLQFLCSDQYAGNKGDRDPFGMTKILHVGGGWGSFGEKLGVASAGRELWAALPLRGGARAAWLSREKALVGTTIWRTEWPIRRPEGESEWESIKILFKGDRNFNKMN
jgi:hypothetical protein